MTSATLSTAAGARRCPGPAVDGSNGTEGHQDESETDGHCDCRGPRRDLGTRGLWRWYLVGGSCGGGETLKIGFRGDLTGENSGIVIPPRNGAKLAIDEYNATNPPVKLELVEYDSQGSADQAVPLIQQAINTDRIVGLVGPAFSGESRSSARSWSRARCATSPARAFVISNDQEYSVGLADAALQAFQAKGVTVERDQFAQGASDYSSSVAKVKAANPDVIVYGGYYAQAGRLLKQLRDSGVTATFASGDGSLDPPLIAGAGAPAAEGTVLGCPCSIPFGVTESASKEFRSAAAARRTGRRDEPGGEAVPAGSDPQDPRRRTDGAAHRA